MSKARKHRPDDVEAESKWSDFGFPKYVGLRALAKERTRECVVEILKDEAEREAKRRAMWPVKLPASYEDIPIGKGKS